MFAKHRKKDYFNRDINPSSSLSDWTGLNC
jgi:hypothetical protein